MIGADWKCIYVSAHRRAFFKNEELAMIFDLGFFQMGSHFELIDQWLTNVRVYRKLLLNDIVWINIPFIFRCDYSHLKRCSNIGLIKAWEPSMTKERFKMSVEIDISINRVCELVQSRTIRHIFINKPNFNFVCFTLIQVVRGYMHSVFREFNGWFANNRPVNNEVSDLSALKINKNVFGIVYLALDLYFSGIVILSQGQKELVSYVAKGETSSRSLVLMKCEVLMGEVGIDTAIFWVLTLDELIGNGTG
jgi:hypothetical protein